MKGQPELLQDWLQQPRGRPVRLRFCKRCYAEVFTDRRAHLKDMHDISVSKTNLTYYYSSKPYDIMVG